MIHFLKNATLTTLRAADRFFDRLYGWRFNPLYHSGAIAAVLSLVLLITGLYLIIFYRIGSPYESVAIITDQVWTGRWIRGLHRYASDAAVVAIAIHAFRMFAQGRTWGPRALAWVSGLVLVGLFMVCGWTGYVMVWDVQAQVLAAEGARFLDVIPIFSEPIGRTFVGGTSLPAAFFFMNLFLHIALPIGLGIVLWIHVSRLARPALAPPRLLLWSSVGLLTLLAIAWPIGMAEKADLLRLPGNVPLDVFYSFWVPITRELPAWTAWVILGVISAPLLLVPRLTRPKPEHEPPPSWVNPRYCTECVQCSIDCPYEAITMVPREDGRFDFVAEVDPERCVSCGICAGSCAPMGVGPPGRTGRDQLAAVRRLIGTSNGSWSETIVIVGCDRASSWREARALDGTVPFPVTCAGSMHSSVIELLVRSGAGGVLVLTCPPRDCWNREGVKWMQERLFENREAELKPRVGRDRLRVVANPPSSVDLAAELADFRAHLASLGPTSAESEIVLAEECV
jgi:ferredoxin